MIRFLVGLVMVVPVYADDNDFSGCMKREIEHYNITFQKAPTEDAYLRTFKWCAEKHPEDAREWCKDALTEGVISYIGCQHVMAPEEMEEARKTEKEEQRAFCKRHPGAGMCLKTSSQE
jgi:hypothetical protein